MRSPIAQDFAHLARHARIPEEVLVINVAVAQGYTKMFLDELSPIFKELTQQPVALLGGFFSGIFRLNLADDPVKSWLDQQAGATGYTASSYSSENGKTSGPQSISID